MGKVLGLARKEIQNQVEDVVEEQAEEQAEGEHNMKISEKMQRNDPLDQIEIGETIDRALKGNFGEVMKAIVEAMKAEYLTISERVVQLPADRTLGRLEALSALQDRLDYAVSISRQLKEEKKEEDKV